LYIISAAGFGVNIPWTETDKTPPGHLMPFQRSIEIMSANTIPKIIIPAWAFKIARSGSRLREIDDGFQEFNKYLVEIIRKAQQDLKQGGGGATADLVSSLVAAERIEGGESGGGGDGGSSKLEFSELVGNTFILLFAGHETTAHTLMFAFTLLALNQKVQEKLYTQVHDVLGGQLPNYEDFNALEYPLAVFQEALRLFPPVAMIPKRAAEDTEIGGYKVRAGTGIGLDVVSMHRNPKYWPEPNEFRPDRWIGENAKTINRNAFIPFSDGARSCLGKRFAQIEAVCIISTIIQNYRIVIPDQIVSDPKSLLEAEHVITLTPKNPLTLQFVPR
jgi:cytochrome P450